MTSKPDECGLTADALATLEEADPERGFAWPDPAPLPTALLPVPAFDSTLLPDSLRPWALDIAERMQCPPDFIGASALIAAGAVIGRRVAIRPKQQDDWTVVPNLWGLTIGRPGIMKTPALDAALAPLHRLVAEAREAHQVARAAHTALALEAELRREVLTKALREAVRANAPTEALRGQLADAEDPAPPTERRYVVNDTTVEKLGALLNENPNGLLLYRDEIAGFLRTMERKGHENDRAFYCEAWTGAGAYTYDRIGRGTLHIRAACVSLLGGIQPGPLQEYLRTANRGGLEDDGLIQRFQLAVYPDVAREWRNVDRWPNTEAKTRAFRLFQALATLEPDALAAHCPAPDELPCLRFTLEAQEIFDGWRAALEARLRAEEEHPAIASHLSKYRSLLPALALILHLAECVMHGRGGPVSLEATEQAVAWCVYLEVHARRIYQPITDRAACATAALAAKLRTGRPRSPFTVRDVYRAGWSGLTDARDDVLPALAQLEALHWLRREPGRKTPDGGRPTALYRANPKLTPGNGRP